jgi:hypothetical protein
LGGAGAPWLALALVSIASSACGFPNYFIQPDADGSGGSPKGGETTSAGATSGVAGNGGTEPIGGTDAAGGSSTGGTGAAGGSTGGTEPTAGGAGQAGADNEPGPLLFDDFESGEASQWLAIAGSAWSVTDDAESQSKVYQQYPVFADFYAAVATHGVWADQIIEAKVKVLSFGGTTTTDVVNLYGRFGNIDNYYAAVLRPDGRVALRASVGGSPPAAIKTSADFGVTTGVWYQLRFELVGTSLKLFVDGNLRVEAVDARLLQGTVAVGGDNSAAAFDDVRVTPP